MTIEERPRLDAEHDAVLGPLVRIIEEAADTQPWALVGAAEMAQLPEAVRHLTVNLRRYERGEPCRTPWPADAMP